MYLIYTYSALLNNINESLALHRVGGLINIHVDDKYVRDERMVNNCKQARELFTNIAYTEKKRGGEIEIEKEEERKRLF